MSTQALAPADYPRLPLDLEAFRPTQEPLELNLADNCDSCGFSKDVSVTGRTVHYSAISQAFVAVRLLSGKVLKFCGHHYAKHEPALVSQSAEVLDHRERINAKPESLSDAAGAPVPDADGTPAAEV